MKVNGSNIDLEVSYDGGLNWARIVAIAKTAAFTTEPNEFGIVAHVENTTSPGPIMSFFNLTVAGD
jgi:hypothetical protein